MNPDELPIEPLEAESSESEGRRGAPSSYVYGAHEILNGLLRPKTYDTFKRRYFPMATPAVLSEFALLTVGDEAGLIAFANRWGTLGYDALPGERSAHKEFTGGDPVAWVWAHLAGIQVALRIYQLWRRHDLEGISQFLASRTVSRRTWAHGPKLNALLKQQRFLEAQTAVKQYVVPPRRDSDLEDGPFVIAGESRRISLNVYASNVTPWEEAGTILTRIINPNLRGVHAQILAWTDTKQEAVGVVQAFDGLISVIYRHLFEIVVGGNVEDCRECGTPFRQTDGRQRFCPPPSWTSESPCAMRFHKREQRRRARGGGGS